MAEYYLGIDIGASSGRHILAHMENGKMVLEEIHRFPNGMSKKDGELCWDTQTLFKEIKAGMKKCAQIGKIPVSVGIDTWAVDFVLLDENDKVIGSTVGYRDGRTNGMDEKVYELIPQKELYNRTGIQKQIFNTIYQLMALKQKKPEQLEKAAVFLMIPDYFHFLLCGIYECDDNTACKPKDKSMGYGTDRQAWISDADIPTDKDSRHCAWQVKRRYSQRGRIYL